MRLGPATAVGGKPGARVAHPKRCEKLNWRRRSSKTQIRNQFGSKGATEKIKKQIAPRKIELLLVHTEVVRG